MRRADGGPEETVAASAVRGGRRNNQHANTAAATAQDIVDAGPEKGRDRGGRAVHRQPWAPPASAGQRTGGAQVAGGAVRAQQGLSGGGRATIRQEAAGRAENRHQGQPVGTTVPPRPTAAAAAEESTETTAEKDEHTARGASAKQRGRRRWRRHGHGEKKEEITTNTPESFCLVFFIYVPSFSSISYETLLFSTSVIITV